MHTNGFILFSSSGRYEDVILIPLAFDTDRNVLENKKNKLEELAEDLINDLESQKENIDKYLSKYHKDLKDFLTTVPQKSTLPLSKNKPFTREEHENHKKIKDFNQKVNDDNRNLINKARLDFSYEWLKSNPPDSEFQHLVKVSERFETGHLEMITPDQCECEYFISEMNKPTQGSY